MGSLNDEYWPLSPISQAEKRQVIDDLKRSRRSALINHDQEKLRQLEDLNY